MYRPRFGLFSFPWGIDTGLDLRKSEMQTPKQAKCRSHNFRAKNFVIGNIKKGRIDDTLFSKPHYNAVGDPFYEKKRLQLRSESKKLRHDLHGSDFKPGGRTTNIK